MPGLLIAEDKPSRLALAYGHESRAAYLMPLMIDGLVGPAAA